MNKIKTILSSLIILLILSSCEKTEILELPPQPPTSNTSTTVTEDYPNLSDQWLFVEGIRYVHTEGITAPDTYDVLPYSTTSYEYVYDNPVCVLDSMKVNSSVWEFTYSDILIDYTHSFIYAVGSTYQTIEVNVNNTKRTYTIVEYQNSGQVLVLRTANQVWSVNNTLQQQYSILKFYRSL